LKIVEKQPLLIRNMLPQLQREVRVQGSLQHRHILRLLTCVEDAAYVYMVLEDCPGGSLRSLCQRQPHPYRLPELRSAHYFAQILMGVSFMHQRCCVHRDLKLDNVLLTADDEVRICDFGWSAEVQLEFLLRTTCGTPHYWAPEIFLGLPQDMAVDLWALGTLVYEMLVGHPPFWGTMEEMRHKVLSVDLRYPPDLLSQEAISLFYCLLQREPRCRVPAARLLVEHPWVCSAHSTHRGDASGASAPAPPAAPPLGPPPQPSGPPAQGPPPTADSATGGEAPSMATFVGVPIAVPAPLPVAVPKGRPLLPAPASPALASQVSLGAGGVDGGRAERAEGTSGAGATVAPAGSGTAPVAEAEANIAPAGRSDSSPRPRKGLRPEAALVAAAFPAGA
jgi:serine/threonine protein kinase